MDCTGLYIIYAQDLWVLFYLCSLPRECYNQDVLFTKESYHVWISFGGPWSEINHILSGGKLNFVFSCAFKCRPRWCFGVGGFCFILFDNACLLWKTFRITVYILKQPLNLHSLLQSVSEQSSNLHFLFQLVLDVRRAWTNFLTSELLDFFMLVILGFTNCDFNMTWITFVWVVSCEVCVDLLPVGVWFSDSWREEYLFDDWRNAF